MRAKKRERLLLVFSEKQQAKAKRSESKKRKQLQSRAKIAEVRVENRCVTPKGATHPFGFWHTSFRQACSGPACLPRATKRSVQSGGWKLAGAAGAQAAVPAKEAAARAPGVLAEGPAGAAQAGRSSPAHLPPGIAVQRRLRAGGRGMPTGNENERPALNPETRTQNKCSWKKRVNRQAREMFAEVSRYTPASKNQKDRPARAVLKGPLFELDFSIRTTRFLQRKPRQNHLIQPFRGDGGRLTQVLPCMGIPQDPSRVCNRAGSTEPPVGCQRLPYKVKEFFKHIEKTLGIV